MICERVGFRSFYLILLYVLNHAWHRPGIFAHFTRFMIIINGKLTLDHTD